MTKMIPATIHSSVKSGAERRLFRKFESAPNTDAWICLHHLGLAKHDTKRRGEIDYCLITPNGIFILEVKGGRFERRNGRYITTDRYDVVHELYESPFDQASSAMFSLEKEIQEHFSGSNLARATYGYGVMLPHVEFNDPGPEGSQQQIYDRRDLRRPITDYIRRLTEFTLSRQSRQHKKLSKTDRNDLLTYLRGDFDLVPDFRVMAEDTHDTLAALTDEQMYVLDAVQDCERVIIDGPAGSGKTLLAIEAARRAARRGRRVAFVCFNRQLAAMVNAKIREESFSGTIDVKTVNSLFHDLVMQSSLQEQFEETKTDADEEELFQKLYPEFAALAAMELETPPFDALIIDEAQDILTGDNLEALSQLIDGGIERGKWYVFLDANNQASVYGRMDSDCLETLRRQTERDLPLTFNCRNTKPIGTWTNIVAEPSRRALCRADGPSVEFLTYGSDDKILGKLEQALNDTRGTRAHPGCVSVLFPQIPSDSDQERLRQLGVTRLRDQDVPLLGTQALENYTWSPISGFKGLENDVVIVAGIDNIESPWWRSVNYVGLSRARVRLYVIIHEDCTPERERRFEKELRKSLGQETKTDE